MRLALQLPDGSRQALDGGSIVLGRGRLAHPSISERQLQLSAVPGVEGVVQLTNIGRNPLVVERQQEEGGAWVPVACLDEGEGELVGPGSRFFILSLQASSMITLTSVAGASDQAQAQAQAPAGTAASAAQQLDADAALAAALAAASDSEEEEHQAQLDSAGEGEESAPAEEPDHLTQQAQQQERLQSPPPLPQQQQQQQQQQQLVGAASQPSERPPKRARLGGEPPLASPFSLLHVRGLPVASNAGPLGLQLRDVVAGELAFALVSNYMVDLAWLLSACPDLARADKLLLVHGEREPSMQAAIQQAAAAAGFCSERFCSHTPPLPIDFGTHHSKAFLLAYRSGGLRLVVHTANLIHCDCNHKTQGLWSQDFPPKPASSSSSSGGSPFEADLARYLATLALPAPWAQAVASLVAGADFSAARAALIASVPGYHSSPQPGNPKGLHSWGHMALRARLAAEQQPARFRDAALVLQASSLGSIDERWLRDEFAASLRAGRFAGSDPTAAAAAAAAAAEPPAAAAAAGKAASSRTLGGLLKSGLEGSSSSSRRLPELFVVWPTVSEVANSREGWVAGGSIPGAHKNTHRPFLRPLYSRWGGEPVGRGSAAPHIKTFARFLPASASAAAAAAGVSQAAAGSSAGAGAPGGNSSDCSSDSAGGGALAELPWLLLTSHNLSKAAWGSLQKQQAQLFVRSYELGVLLLPSLEAAFLRHPHRFYSCTAGNHDQLASLAAANSPQVRSVRFFAVDQAQLAAAPAAPGPDGCAALQLPVPYRLPPAPYAPTDEPWAWDVASDQIDGFGVPRGAQPHPLRLAEPMYGMREMPR